MELILIVVVLVLLFGGGRYWVAVEVIGKNWHGGVTVGTGTANNHSLEYWNAGSILSPSFVPPGSTILLSANLS